MNEETKKTRAEELLENVSDSAEELRGANAYLVWIAICITVIMLSQCAQCAKAEVIKTTLFRVHSPKALNDWQYDTVIARVRNQYRQDMNVGIRIRQKHVWAPVLCKSYVWNVSGDLFGEALTSEFYKWVTWGMDKKLNRKRSYGWIIEGATSKAGNYLYSWGKAFQGCYKDQPRYFVATAIYNNGLGANRLDFSEKVISHEMAHTLGAYHVNDRTLMNTYLGSFYEQDQHIPFSETSISQIKACLNSKEKGRN